jgi:hypothetical protein
MIEVLKIPVPKDRLKAMPKEERVFLLLLGYGSNQISMLQKLLMFSCNLQCPDEVELTLSASQTQMLLRLTIGALHETWLLIERHFIKSVMAKDYETLIDAGGRKALADLKRRLGGSNVLSSIRNDFAFHYPKIDDVDAAFASACNDKGLDDLWNFYFSKYGFNSFFLPSELTIIHGVSRRLGASELHVAQAQIMPEVHAAVVGIFEFTKAFVAAVWLRHFASEMQSEAVIRIEGAKQQGSVWIPFFIELDGVPDS